MQFKHTFKMALTFTVFKFRSLSVKLNFRWKSLFWTPIPNEMRQWSSHCAISVLSTANCIPPSSSILHYYLQLCGNSKSLSLGRQAHQKIIQCGFGQNSFLVTKLVQMYANCKDLASAQKLFKELSEPNVFAWTAILGFYLWHGMYEECVGTYGEMILKGVLPDEYVFPKVLRACTQLSYLQVGIQVHKNVILCGYENSVLVCNSLIEMQSKCREIECAKRVFDEMMGRDLLSWNLMISGYVFNGLLGLAIELFDVMNLDNCEPDVVTLNTAMDAYSQMGMCDEAKRIFKHIKEPNVISWTTLISGYSRIGMYKKSLGIFRDMLHNSMIYPDLGSLSTALVSCPNLGYLLTGKEIHGYGIKLESGIAFYNSAGPALFTMYAKCRRLHNAKNVFKLMDPTQVVTWNAMILGFTDLGLEDLALQCFRKMQRAEIKVDQTTISTFLPTCTLQFGKLVHALIMRNGSDLVIPVWNALIRMYSKSGSIGAVDTVFSNMVNRDLVSWNSMMGGYAMNGLGQAALELPQEMNRLGMCPNSVTLTSVLSAYTHSGLVDEGLHVFYTMTKEYGFNPTMEHYACIVDMLARDGRLEDAVSFIQNMPLEPDKCIWGALLAACPSHHNVNVAKLAAEQLVRLEPENAGHCVTLSHIYAKSGTWNDALEVRKKMESWGLLKPSGSSWFECGN